MKFYADLHIHSKYSRACSRECDLEHLAWWAARKGIGVVGTGDFTHPAWIEQLRTQLVPAEPGLFRLQPDLEADVLRRLPSACRTPVRFLLSSEISTIYKRDGRTRKVHHLLYAPDFQGVEEITRRLARIGNLASDGRPILGLDSRDLLEITLESGDDCYLVPAHVWTPWFSALGSQSGFDAVADCYADLAEHIFAVETGLSSDPEMNWRVSGLDRYRLVSNSDAHSPPMLAREATVFDTALDYFSLARALRTGDGFGGTVELFPEEGKYHLDGHRACGIRTDPGTTRELDGRCPACGKPLTVGVLHRVEALADRPSDHQPEGADPFRSLVPLPEIVSEIVGVGPKSKTVLAPLATECGTDYRRFLAELALGVEADTWDPRADRISLLTLHAAKGLEFPVVFIVGCEDGLLPLRHRPAGGGAGAASGGSGAADADAAGGTTEADSADGQVADGQVADGQVADGETDEAEERRLLFVGMTRATTRLVLLTADRRLRWGSVRDCTPSPFLADIAHAHLERRTGVPGGHSRPCPAHRQLRLL